MVLSRLRADTSRFSLAFSSSSCFKRRISTGPIPADCGRKGTKHHVAFTEDGIPVACIATAANVNDTVLFERLFRAAFAVVARIRMVFADRGYDAQANRALCQSFRAEPHIHRRRQPSGSGLGQRR